MGEPIQSENFLPQAINIGRGLEAAAAKIGDPGGRRLSAFLFPNFLGSIESRARTDSENLVLVRSNRGSAQCCP